MTIYQINSCQLKLTFEIYNPNHETIITSYKANQKHIVAQFLINLILKNKIEKIN